MTIKQLVILLCLCTFLTHAQTEKPKLVVGIVVDQMRSDYISRYWDRFGPGGFKRLVEKGYQFKNTHYNYIPTYTGPGHASIYTGATPRAHGIIANDWFVKQSGADMYCVQDEAMQSVGTDSKAGKASPANLISSTIGDELKMHSNSNSKVFAVAIKDRSAILPAGHNANGAFWLDNKSGKFISSSFYLKALPDWVNNFNNKNLSEKYLALGWQTLYPIQSYTLSLADNNPYEGSPFGTSPTLPYTFEKFIEKQNYSIIKGTPYGNSLTKDLAIECIKKEQLGKDEQPDILSISFSSTDVIAHTFGPRSIEIEDTYLRLDKDLEEILATLDKEVGAKNYVVFLTADHGGADVPNHLIANKIPAGYLTENQMRSLLKTHIKQVYTDTSLILNLSNAQIFLNEQRIEALKLDKSQIETELCKFLLSIEGVAEAYSVNQLKYHSFPLTDYRNLLQNGINHKMSGDVCFILQPAWMDHDQTGTTHGAGYNYDTHVPLLFYGKNIPKGHSYHYTSITQIAPTVCELLKISQPNACNSEPLNSYFK